MSLTLEDRVALTQVMLLQRGGVSGWDWYGESLEAYAPTGDEVTDAHAFLAALNAGGIDGWDWLGESLSGLDDYEEYLESLSSLDAALDFDAWAEAQRNKSPQKAPAAPSADKAGRDRAPKTAAEFALFAHLLIGYPERNTQDLFETLILEKNIWAPSAFPKEYKVALKEIRKGVESPIQVAQSKLYDLILTNGKLDSLIRSINS